MYPIYYALPTKYASTIEICNYMQIEIRCMESVRLETSKFQTLILVHILSMYLYILYNRRIRVDF